MRSSTMVRLALAILMTTLLQIGCAQPQNTNTGTAVATPEPTPDKTAITDELIRIENDWPRIIKERDVEAVKRLEADDALIVYWDGNSGTKDQDIRDIGSGNLSAESIVMSETKVTVIDQDAAVVTGLITITNGQYKAEGGTMNVSGNYRFLDTFARRDGQWKLVGSSSVKLGPGAVVSASPKASPAPTASPVTKAGPAMKPSPAARPAPTRRPAPPVPASTP